MRHKEKEVRFEKKIEFRVTEGMFKYLQDFADNEGGDISKIVRGIIEMHIDRYAKEVYYWIDSLNKRIEETEMEVEHLKELKAKILTKQ